MIEQEIVKEKAKTITMKAELDATQAKEELKEVGDQIDTVIKKYKEFNKLSGKRNLIRDINIILSSIATMIWLYKGDVIHATFCLILILVIGQVYEK